MYDMEHLRKRLILTDSMRIFGEGVKAFAPNLQGSGGDLWEHLFNI